MALGIVASVATAVAGKLVKTAVGKKAAQELASATYKPGAVGVAARWVSRQVEFAKNHPVLFTASHAVTHSVAAAVLNPETEKEKAAKDGTPSLAFKAPIRG